jgi:type IV secretory pathway TraG/TraD family ATPase VirD4
MNATKILWGQVLAVSAVVLAFLRGATQWVAWRLAFQPQLGHPWFNILGWPVYDPPAFFWWWFAYDAYARPIFVEGAYIAASGGIAAAAVAIAMSVWRAREVKKVTTYGSARWAETREVRLAGLLDHDGGEAPRVEIRDETLMVAAGPRRVVDLDQSPERRFRCMRRHALKRTPPRRPSAPQWRV